MHVAFLDIGFYVKLFIVLNMFSLSGIITLYTFQTFKKDG